MQLNTSTVFLALFAAASLVNVACNVPAKGRPWINWATKPLLMPLLALFYVTSGAPVDKLIVAALFFGFLGDVFLMLPGSSEKLFMAGLGSFLVNQALYVVAFNQPFSGLAGTPPAFLAVLLPLAGFAALVYRALAPGLGPMKPPVIVYMTVIICMCFSAVIRRSAPGPLAYWLTVAGAVSFLASDSILAYDRFRRKLPAGRAIVMATYIAAQLLIVLGFVVSR